MHNISWEIVPTTTSNINHIPALRREGEEPPAVRYKLVYFSGNFVF